MGNGSPNTNRSIPKPSGSSAKGKMIMGGIIAAVVIIVIVIVCFIGKMFLSAEGAIQHDKYQALFLTNGQVYFGKLSDVDKGYVKLTDIYYLQVQQQVQPKDGQNKDQQQPQVSLTKLGSELHGPEDVMHISRDQILFWENLKADGKVAEAVKSYLEQQQKK